MLVYVLHVIRYVKLAIPPPLIVQHVIQLQLILTYTIIRAIMIVQISIIKIFYKEFANNAYSLVLDVKIVVLCRLAILVITPLYFLAINVMRQPQPVITTTIASHIHVVAIVPPA